jgi:uncharacterized membrane protein YgaE (UPF0421/DUF939 family)
MVRCLPRTTSGTDNSRMDSPRELAKQIRRRFDRAVVGRTAQTALAAGAAWELARQIPGHTQPFFAPIAAVIGLTAEPGTRGRQTLRLIAGVAVGISVGAAVVAVAGRGPLQIVVAVAVSLVVTTAAGVAPITVAQSAASAILVVALHVPGSNVALQRLVDALVGGAIAILLAQLLFPIDPITLVRRESQHLRDDLASSLRELAQALVDHDRELADRALGRIDAIDTQRVHAALILARDVARRAPRRRAARRRLEPLDPLVAALDAAVADARSAATGVLRTLGTEGHAPPEAGEALRALADGLHAFDPAEVRDAVRRAREAANTARDADPSLGVGVLAHAAHAIADELDRVADAREAQRT